MLYFQFIFILNCLFILNIENAYCHSTIRVSNSDQIRLDGCWSIKRHSSSPDDPKHNLLIFCFQKNGQITGAWLSNGDGGDLQKKWRLLKENNLVVDREVCKLSADSSRTAFQLTDCKYDGTWKKCSNSIAQISRCFNSNDNWN